VLKAFLVVHSLFDFLGVGRNGVSNKEGSHMVSEPRVQIPLIHKQTHVFRVYLMLGDVEELFLSILVVADVMVHSAVS